MEATVEVTVRCGELTGVLHQENFSAKRDCISCSHGTVTPRKFEILGGRAASKSWKKSIRSEKGETLWSMIKSGKLHLYDAPKLHRRRQSLPANVKIKGKPGRPRKNAIVSNKVGEIVIAKAKMNSLTMNGMQLDLVHLKENMNIVNTIDLKSKRTVNDLMSGDKLDSLNQNRGNKHANGGSKVRKAVTPKTKSDKIYCKRGRPFKNASLSAKIIVIKSHKNIKCNQPSKHGKSTDLIPLHVMKHKVQQCLKDASKTNVINSEDNISHNKDIRCSQLSKPTDLTLSDMNQGPVIQKRRKHTDKVEKCWKGVSKSNPCSEENLSHHKDIGSRQPSKTVKLTDSGPSDLNQGQGSVTKKRRRRSHKVERCLKNVSKSNLISEDSISSEMNHGHIIKKRRRRSRKEQCLKSISKANLISDENPADGIDASSRSKTARNTQLNKPFKRKRYRLNNFEKGLNTVVSSKNSQAVLQQTCVICGTKLNDSTALSYHDILFHSAVSSKIFNDCRISGHDANSTSDNDQCSLNQSFLELSDIGSRKCDPDVYAQNTKSVSHDNGFCNQNTSYLEASGLIGRTLTRGTLAKLASICVHTPLADCVVQKPKISKVDIRECGSTTTTIEMLPSHSNADVCSPSSIIANVIKQYKEVLDLSKEALEETTSLNKRLGDISEMIKSIKTNLKGVSETLELSNLSKLVVRDDITADDYDTFSKILEKLTNFNEKPK